MNKPDEYKENTRVNKNCLNDLLKGFFEFYATYPFGSPGKDTFNVIVTRTSQLSQSVPELAKLSPYINVQDPFELSHNLAANVSKNTMERFVAESRASNELLSYGSLLRKSNSKCWGLILLTTKKALDLNPSQKLASQVEVNLPVSNGPKETIDFVLYLLQNCLLFEPLSTEQYLSQKRKRTKMLTQICNQVDSLGLNCSPKRLKISLHESSDVMPATSDENNNNDNSDDEEFKSEKKAKLSSHIMSARNNTWIGRRTVKRELGKVVGAGADGNELELEKMASQKLFESNGESKVEIHFRLEFFGVETDAKNLKLKFSLMNDVQSVSELNNFATLVHFMDTFINYSHEKFYTQWSSSQCSN